MKNFIFKSRETLDLQKFSLKLNLIQTEARHQRDDLSDIKRRLTRVIGLLTDSASIRVTVFVVLAFSPRFDHVVSCF